MHRWWWTTSGNLVLSITKKSKSGRAPMTFFKRDLMLLQKAVIVEVVGSWVYPSSVCCPCIMKERHLQCSHTWSSCVVPTRKKQKLRFRKYKVDVGIPFGICSLLTCIFSFVFFLHLNGSLHTEAATLFSWFQILLFKGILSERIK